MWSFLSIILFFFLSFFLGKSVWSLSVNKESRPRLLVSPPHSDTVEHLWLGSTHTHTCTNTITNTHTHLIWRDYNDNQTNPMLSFFCFLKSRILDLKSCTYLVVFSNQRKAVFTVIHQACSTDCACELTWRIYSIFKVTSHQEPFALF